MAAKEVVEKERRIGVLGSRLEAAEEICREIEENCCEEKGGWLSSRGVLGRGKRFGEQTIRARKQQSITNSPAPGDDSLGCLVWYVFGGIVCCAPTKHRNATTRRNKKSKPSKQANEELPRDPNQGEG